MRIPLLLLLTPALAGAGELSFPAPATTPDRAFFLAQGKLGTRVAGSTGTETLPLFESPESPGGWTRRPLGVVHFEWLDAAAPPSDYRRHFDPATGIATTRFQRGGAGFTATTFISRHHDLLVLHLRTDKPGFLSFRVRLDGGGTAPTVEDRRILALPTARVWVFPMESEVRPGDGEIRVLGEGEALVFAAASASPAQAPPLRDRLAPLGFGRPALPDLCAVWNDLLSAQQAARPSSAGK